MPELGVLHMSSLLFEGLRLPKKLDLKGIPLTKSVVMLASMPIFHPCLKFSTREI
jgi:hypothetical protein